MEKENTEQEGGITSEEFYGVGIIDKLHLDYFKYKGRGRPKKTDYSPLSELQRKINTLVNMRINAQFNPERNQK